LAHRRSNQNKRQQNPERKTIVKTKTAKKCKMVKTVNIFQFIKQRKKNNNIIRKSVSLHIIDEGKHEATTRTNKNKKKIVYPKRN
jgi:hypothetical protein